MPIMQNPLWVAQHSQAAVTGFPDGTNRPHIISTGPPPIMAYTDGTGTARTVSLAQLPAPGSTFGVDATTLLPNNGAFYNPSGYVQINVDNTLIDGYEFNGVSAGPLDANGFVLSRCWFHNIDGQDNWALWVHQTGTWTGLTMTDCLCQGSSPSITGPDGLLKVDGTITGVVLQRCHTFNCSSAVQFAPITGPGTQPYVNKVLDNFFEYISDPSALGLHLEDINVSSGTGGLLVQHNHVTGPTGQTASIYLCHDSGDVGNITLNNNLLDGLPQNTIYAGDTGLAGGVLIAAAGNMQVTNNKFANTGGQNPGGYVIDPAPGDSRLVTTGNVYWPSLASIPGM